jgi:hypothetical protein
MVKLSPSFYSDLGANCHQQAAGMFPVMAITDLENNILITNYPTAKSDWVVIKGRVNINTYWDASTAYFQCSLSSLDMTEDIPPAPGGLFRHALNKSGGVTLNSSDKAAVAQGLAYDGKREANYNKLDEGVKNLKKDFKQSDVEKMVKNAIPNASPLAQDRVVRDILSQAGIRLTEKDKENPSNDKYSRKDDQVINFSETLISEVNAEISSVDGIDDGDNDARNAAITRRYSPGSEESRKNTSSVDNDFSADGNAPLVDTAQDFGEAMSAPDNVRELPLNTLDEICIFLGYLPEMRPVTPQDINDDRLLRRGVWVIDTITRSGGASTGIIMTVQCRDRLKYLMDTFGSYNTAEKEDVLVEDVKNFATGEIKGLKDEERRKLIQVSKRSDVILKIARRGIGQTHNVSIGGRRIRTGWIYDPPTDSMTGDGNDPGDYSVSDDGKKYTVNGDVYEQRDDGKYYQKLSTASQFKVVNPDVYESAVARYNEWSTSDTSMPGSENDKDPSKPTVWNIDATRTEDGTKDGKRVSTTRVNVVVNGRDAVVDFNAAGGRKAALEVPISDTTYGKYTPNEGGTALIYGEFERITGKDNNGNPLPDKQVPGTDRSVPIDDPTYTKAVKDATDKDPGASARGLGTSPDVPIAGGVDPFRPWKGSQTILTQQATLTEDSGDVIEAVDSKGTAIVYSGDVTDEKMAEILLAMSPRAKARIKNDLNLEQTHTLTVPELRTYLEEFGTAILNTPIAETNNTVDTLQYVNSLQGRVDNVAVSREMKFNIITGRGQYLQNADSYIGQDFIVTDRAPLDYIKFLSQQEPWVTTVFQDSRTGEFWYVPRGLDTSGLSDPARFNRTYFFRQFPHNVSAIANPNPGSGSIPTPVEGDDSAPDTTSSPDSDVIPDNLIKQPTFSRSAPHLATMLHSFREEVSSVSTRTNILVQSQAPRAMTGNEGAFIHVSVIPYGFEDRAYACSFFTVTDDTATKNPGALIALALSFGKTVGKELRSAAATLLGDPSLIPGEAIQVVGSPQHQGYTDIAKVNADRQAFFEMNQDYEDFYRNLPNVIKGLKTDIDYPLEANSFIDAGKNGQPIVANVKSEELSTDQMLSEAAAERQQTFRNTFRFLPEPPTMWRVEGVIDRFNDGVDGYYTEVSLLSCF